MNDKKAKEFILGENKLHEFELTNLNKILNSLESKEINLDILSDLLTNNGYYHEKNIFWFGTFSIYRNEAVVSTPGGYVSH